jgi:hypothetical protein
MLNARGFDRGRLCLTSDLKHEGHEGREEVGVSRG